jgi:anti-sigma regulatory factor (Ser/Thr protein kinase)
VSRQRCIHLQNDPSQVLAVVNEIIDGIGYIGSLRDRKAIRISLVEMITNAIEHGNLAIGYERKRAALHDGTFEELVETRRRMEPYASRRVYIEYAIEPHQAAFTIRDEGAGFDWHAVPDPRVDDHLSMMHGRGILIARTNMDECVYHQQGNAVTLVKYFTSSYCRCLPMERIGPCKLQAS